MIFIDSKKKSEKTLQILYPNAKIVGNMMDIKKQMAITAYTVIMPCAAMATMHNKILMAAYKASNLFASINFIKKVPMNRPIKNAMPHPPK